MSETNLLDVWFPESAQAEGAWTLRHEVAADLRAAAAELVTLDADAVDVVELEALAADVKAVRARLEALPDVRHHGWLAEVPGTAGALIERSPVSGRANAVAPPLVLQADSEGTSGHVTFSDAYQGPPGGVHGGAIAAVFDELLGVAQVQSGTAGHTGTLTIRYRALTPVNERIDLEAGIAGRDGRKLRVWGRATHGDTLLAEAEGIFIISQDAADAADRGDLALREHR